MSKRFAAISATLVAFIGSCIAFDATAASQRTFVASTGNDANTCSLALPCRSFNIAIAQTLSGGEVIVLDSAGYGAATITQPVSVIAPPGIYAGVSVFSGGATNGVGIVVNPGTGKVTLRGLSINGLGGTTGIAYQSGDALYVDGVTVTNFPAAAVSASVGATGSLYITNSVFRDNGTGATLAATAGTLTVNIDGSTFERNAMGAVFADSTAGTVHNSVFVSGTNAIQAAPTTSGKSAKLEVRDCTISDNAGAGVTAGSVAGAPATVSVVTSLVSGNVTGILAQASSINSAYVSDSTITRNVTGLSTSASATIVSGGDNRLVGNTTNGSFTSTVTKL